jgi:hypothetical protein
MHGIMIRDTTAQTVCSHGITLRPRIRLLEGQPSALTQVKHSRPSHFFLFFFLASMEHGAATLNVEDLPEEVLQQVFLALGHPSHLLPTSLVCRYPPPNQPFGWP